MAIKKLTFAFDVALTELLSLIATGNADLRIAVMADDKIHKLAKLGGPAAPKLLEGPKKPHGNTGGPGPKVRAKDSNGQSTPGWQMILRALAKNPDHTKHVADLGQILGGAGLSKKSVSPQLSMMQKRGWAKRIDAGTYQMTAKGGVLAGRLGFDVATRHLKPKKKKKPAPPPAPIEVPAEELNHG